MTDPLQDFITDVDGRMRIIFDLTGVIYPMWHVVLKSGEQFAMTSPADDKDTAATMMRAYFELVDVVRYAFVDEAWQLFIPATDEAKREIMQRGIRSHPDRREILMYQAEDETGSLTAHRDIIRPPHGKPQLGPLEFFRSQQSEGRLVGMLPQRGTAQ